MIEQSSCFAFIKGKIVTYNDEISCRQKCDVPLEGAIRADALLALLRKLPDDELQVSQEGAELVIQGKRRTARMGMEAQVLLPIQNIEKPGEWLPMEDGWLEAVTLVEHCAGRDQAKFRTVCIHLMPDFMEASDSVQVTRVRVKTGVQGSVLVRASSLKHIPELGVTEINETESWIHFRNPGTGLTFSCRRFIEEFPDMLPILKVRGTAITLPKGLGNAADRASVFSCQQAEENKVRVELKPGQVRVQGEGVSGRYTEVKKIGYDGEPLVFLISPELLLEITKRHNEAEITEGKLRVSGGHWVYVTALGRVATNDAAE
jgi:hypothetical protein